jgi:hypothetical protein
LDRRRLPTSADRFDVRARPRAPSPSPARIARPLAGHRDSYVCATSASGETRHPQRANPILHTTESRMPLARPATGTGLGRQGRAEGLARLRESAPPRFPAEHLVSSTRCHERLGVSSAAPRDMAPFERPCPLAHELTRGPSFRRPPAKENAFQKTEVLSTASSSFRVHRDRSRCPLGLGLLVTPPALSWGSPTLGVRPPVRSGIAIEEYQRLCVRPGTPRP